MYTKEETIKRILDWIDNSYDPQYKNCISNYDPRYKKDDIYEVLKCFVSNDCDYVDYKCNHYHLDFNHGSLLIDTDPFCTFTAVPLPTPVPRKNTNEVPRSIKFRSLI